MVAPIQAVRGMNDVLPDAARVWQRFEDAARAVFVQYGYRNLRVPIVESTPLFVRAIGAVTDVVEHEMYTFEDKLNGESLTLRPEATAGIVRACIEHPQFLYDGGPQRIWTSGPMFRHERPQKGRYRQFHQIDCEALGFTGPDIDAEQIVMLSRLWKKLGLAEVIHLKINSIGDPAERRAHRALLIEHFERHADILDDDARRRLHANPLRILDSKNPAMQEMLHAAPRLVDVLGAESRAHFDGLKQALTDAGLAFEIDARLVRGLDYYNRTVFEWVTDRLGAQSTVCGGGRYDGLFEQLGGKPTPACGFAIGIERMILLLEDTPMRGRRRAARLHRPRRHGGGGTGVACRRIAARTRPRRGHSRGRRQLQIADEEGRCQRRAFRAHHRRRGGRGGHRGRQAAARHRRAGRGGGRRPRGAARDTGS